MTLLTLFRGRCALIMISVMTALSPGVASADWFRAESERFIVYSDGSERSLRQYVQKLETFDRVMRYRFRTSINEAPLRKLPIYLVGSRTGLLRVHPDTQPNVVGTYFPTEEDIFAVAIRDENDEVLLHEYAHHFMLGNMHGAYPGWFVEGFAEYFMTADFEGDGVVLGKFSDNRAYWLINEEWIPLDVLLRSRPSDVRRGSHRNTYYPVAWLLTHWFLSDPARTAQLDAYLIDVAKGGDPVEAMERATGQTLSDIRRALRQYMARRLVGTRIVGEFPDAQMTITRLPPSANDLLLINQRLKIGVQTDDRAALGQETLRLAARHGDDPLALLAAGHAGMHFNDKPAGEIALQRLLEIEPENVEALQFIAQERLRQSRESDNEADETALRREARAFLARAYAVADNDYRTLNLLNEMREGQPGYPNANDMLVLGLAFDRAPQLPGVRLNYAAALASTDEDEDAIAVLMPLANSPHGGGAAETAERMIADIKAGQTPTAPEETDGQTEIVQPEPEPPAPSEPQEPKQPAA